MKLFPLAKPLAASALLCTAWTASAQTVQPCGTDEVRWQMVQENPDLLRQEAAYELGLQEYLQVTAGQREDADTVVYVLPVVFHILYDPSATSDAHNISDDQVFQAVNVMNRDFAKLNADTTEICCGFNSIAANSRIRFQLATKDPFGNCTNGIDRITTLRASDASNFSKLNPWFREHYINIWVVNTMASMGSFQPAGFSQFPPDVQDASGALRDGVILLNTYTGETGTSSVFTSRTLTHEIGHFLNLSHTWGNTNAPGVACGDDGVDDTPMTKGHDNCTPSDLSDSFCSLEPVDTSYTFQDVTLTSGTTDPTPVPTAHSTWPVEPALTFSPAVAAGVAANSSVAGSFSFAGWDGGAVDGDSLYTDLTGQIGLLKYYTFTVTPQLGKSMSLTGLRFKAGRAADGPRTFAVRTSQGSYASNLTATVTGADTNAVGVRGSNNFFFLQDTTGTLSTVTATLPASSFTNLNTPVTFRIYAWNAEGGTGYFTVDSLALLGDHGKIENTQNYMEYSYCEHMFTNGQRDRMRAALNSSVSSRNNLWADANHLFTGTNGHEATCAPEADFYTLTPFVCPGTSVQFKANTKRATATSWQWTFDGGNPATSTLQNPTVTFNDAGPRNVTLTVANDHGSSSISKWNAVTIGANYTEGGDPLQEGFDSASDLNLWPRQNLENNQSYWHWTNVTGHDAPGCAKLNASQTYTLVQDAFFPNNFSDIDNLLTPSLGLKFNQNITVSFWYAYSTQTGNGADITESLRVYASSSCGESWLERLELDGSDLVTAGVRSAGYVPAADEWRQATITLSSIYATDKVRLKFEFRTGRFSNDLFIDDVNITSTNVGIDENAHSGTLGLVPNPATNSVDVLVDLADAPSGTLSFLDMTGRLVHSATVPPGTDRMHFNLHEAGLTGGVYLVRLQHANGQRVERLVVR